MWLITIVFGGILGLLGIYGYAESDRRSLTALIPCAFGVVLLICGGLSRSPLYRKHAMHVAVLVGLIGFVMPAIMAVPKLPSVISDGNVLRADGSDASRAIIMQTIMAAICLVFVILCVNSFIQARRARRTPPV